MGRLIRFFQRKRLYFQNGILPCCGLDFDHPGPAKSLVITRCNHKISTKTFRNLDSGKRLFWRRRMTGVFSCCRRLPSRFSEATVTCHTMHRLGFAVATVTKMVTVATGFLDSERECQFGVATEFRVDTLIDQPDASLSQWKSGISGARKTILHRSQPGIVISGARGTILHRSG